MPKYDEFGNFVEPTAKDDDDAPPKYTDDGNEINPIGDNENE